jgi:nitrate reductase NapE component
VPQLRGQEQKVLVDLLVEHLSEPGQLDRALLHSGLGNLSKFSEKGTLVAMTADLVRAMSSQFRVVEFVEAVLQGDFLKGHCPPIEDWLAANREELLRRKLHPTVSERIQHIASPLLTRWLALPIVLVALVGGYWFFIRNVEVVVGPLRHQVFDLQQSIAPLTTEYYSRPSRGMLDLIEEISTIAESSKYGRVILCKPLEVELKNPTVEVEVVDADGNHLNDPDGLFQIHWLPPDRDREEQGRWGPTRHLKEGVITDKHDGVVPAGTIITVVYHRKEPRPFPPTFNVWVKG